jgi:RNA polymerase sigma-70 factor (ECF subfamily)
MDRLALLNAMEARLKGLLLLGLAGDSASYRIFLKDLSGHLRAFLRRRLVSSPDEVEDLLQESLLAIHNQRHTYDERQPLTAWVQAIARYKLIDFLRHRARNETLGSDEGMDVFAAADDGAADARRDVATLLEQLPARQRLPIIHMKIEGLSVAETARLTGMSEAAVKVGVHRGLKMLAAKMRDER